MKLLVETVKVKDNVLINKTEVIFYFQYHRSFIKNINVDLIRLRGFIHLNVVLAGVIYSHNTGNTICYVDTALNDFKPFRPYSKD